MQFIVASIGERVYRMLKSRLLSIVGALLKSGHIQGPCFI